MIISASRRTDIPAFYAEWFINRVKAGWCAVPNPFNPKQVRRVSLLPEDVDLAVFWTRNAAPLLQHLPYLDDLGIPYYFQYTLLDYPRTIEERMPPTARLLDTFKKLAETIGSEKVIWRYDPIIISSELTPEWHLDKFNALAGKLSGCTNRVVVSLVDYYKKTEKNMSGYDSEHHLHRTPEKDSSFAKFARSLAAIAKEHSLTMQSCAETVDLKPFGIPPGKCIDDGYIQDTFGLEVTHGKDSGQRDACRCVKSADIGIYDTCLHGCLYCYATKRHDTALRQYQSHDPHAPALLPLHAEAAAKLEQHEKERNSQPGLFS